MLSSFGKFQNKELNLTQGLNIIYGDNEAGKSTLHKFIEGMFYGFYKPYAKSRRTTEDYESYLPWYNKSQFQGILIYEHENDEYRIERNFLKRNESVEIYDNVTGEKITHLFDYDPVIKLHQPHTKHFKLNQTSFTNTISIKQLGSKTNDALIKEVKDRLINFSRSKDEQISIKKVLEQLNEKKEAIGSIRKKKSTYGMLVVKINHLKKEKEKSQVAWQNIYDLQEQLNRYNKELISLNQNKNDYTEQLELVKHTEYEKTYKKIVDLNKTLVTIEDRMMELKSLDRIVQEEVDTILETITYHSLLKETLEEKKLQLQKFKLEYEEQYKQLDLQPYFAEPEARSIETILGVYSIYEQLSEDASVLEKEIQELESRMEFYRKHCNKNIGQALTDYEKLEKEKNEMSIENKENEMQELLPQIHILRNIMKRYTIALIILISLFIGSVVASILLTNSSFTAIAVGMLALGVLSGIQRQKAVKNVRNYEETIERIKLVQAERNDTYSLIENKQKELLAHYQCQSKEALKALNDKHASHQILLEDTKKHYQLLCDKRKDKQQSLNEKATYFKFWLDRVMHTTHISKKNIEAVKEAYDIYKQVQKELMETKKRCAISEDNINKSTQHYQELEESIAAFYEVIDVPVTIKIEEVKQKKNELEALKVEHKNKQYVKENLLGEDTLEELENKLKAYKNKQETPTYLTYDEIKDALEGVNNQIIDIHHHMSGVQEKIHLQEKAIRTLVDIDQDLLITQKERKALDDKMASLSLATEALESISKDIQNNFAPELNKQVSQMMSSVTSEKYANVKITPDMNILVQSPINHELVCASKLSSGTIDQMCFGLRLGLIDVIYKENHLPFLLDDCFVQYDTQRLKNMLKLLSKLNRQILLFTCHTREEQVMRELGITFNSIKLDKSVRSKIN